MSRKERLFGVTVYFGKDEFARVRKIAKMSGLSLSDVIRLCTKYVLDEVLVHRSFVDVVSKSQKKEGDVG